MAKKTKAMKQAKAAGVTTDATALDAFRRLLRDGAAVHDRHRDAVMAGDEPEHVHQARVSLRRMRALVRGFRDMLHDDARSQLADLLGERFRRLGPLRDADVQALALAGKDGGAQAVSRAADLRRQVRDALDTGDKLSLKAQVEAILHETTRICRGARRQRLAKAPVAVIAARALQIAWTEILAFGPDIAALSPDDRHEFRKKAKDFRYLADYFAVVFQGDPRRMLKKLAKMQDALGHANDLHNLRLSDAPLPDDLDQAEASAMAAAQKAWRKLRKSKAWWASVSA